MRLFVGVALAENVRAAADAVSRELQRSIDPRVRAAWVPAEKMHLTVRFIGQVEDARVPAILSALQPALPVRPFEIALSGCGMFPRSGPPRVLWIGLSEGMPALREMHEEFDRRLRPLGFEPEDRPFNAHLTLARVKEVPRELVRSTREIVVAARIPSVRCRVDGATVFQSQLSPKGSTYVSLAKVSFSDSGGFN